MWDDLRLVEQFGGHLDEGNEEKVRDVLIRSLLKIRVKKGGVHYFKLNRAQKEYSRTCSKRNIILKARQIGITTYVAARFFLQTITRPGTLTVQVAHTEESAQAIFNIVHRFWENLPNSRVRRGALIKSRSNIRQIVFPRLDSEYRVETADDNAGRGMTIHNLHCSEVSRWPRGAEDTLASLRAAVVPEGEIVVESTPSGAAGLFYEEWNKAEESGYTKHFYPWWYETSYKEDVSKKPVGELTDEEKDLVTKGRGDGDAMADGRGGETRADGERARGDGDIRAGLEPGREPGPPQGTAGVGPAAAADRGAAGARGTAAVGNRDPVRGAGLADGAGCCRVGVAVEAGDQLHPPVAADPRHGRRRGESRRRADGEPGLHDIDPGGAGPGAEGHPEIGRLPGLGVSQGGADVAGRHRDLPPLRRVVLAAAVRGNIDIPAHLRRGGRPG